MLDLYYIRYYVIVSLPEGNPFNIQHSLNLSILQEVLSMQVSISVTTALLGVNASPSKLYQSITCSQSHYAHCPLKEQLNISCSGYVINAKLSLTNYSAQVFLGLINLSFKPKAALVLSAGNAQLEIQYMSIVLMIYINKTIETNEITEKCALCLFVPTNHCGCV